ncbi:Aste57867_9083 [Aphanomyces stellatus]|uniref:Aste57867_9083 protein n=1 Tax=Aphanomyces stellatus TaxID=120398 RepID=A0A485KM62_9STRA|nr:hypothetical protein As57867_009047 [Aphanomyces stellatus]VFT85967.1 Aste57867_9083 [Aphanomyces stellatus]
MRVQPATRPTDYVLSVQPPSRLRVWHGCVYVALTLVLSCAYLAILRPAFSNDLWWPHYNTTTHQALLIDLFNLKLSTQATGAIDFTQPWATMAKSYTHPVSTTDVYPVYVRRLAYLELTSIEYAVVNLRTLSGAWSMWMGTQYCWVDLGREFEVAHTARRQARCADRYASNGAMYMETVLRNQNWDDFMANYGGDGGMFTVSVQAWLEQTPSGQRWLDATSSARQTTTLAQETLHWRAFNLTSFTLQWQNRAQPGISESVAVANALNMQQSVTLKNLPFVYGAWTSISMYWLPMDDLYILQSENRSFVRSAANSFLQPPTIISFEDQIGLQTPHGAYLHQLAAFRTLVGPFNSVDTYYVPIPVSVLTLVNAFQTTLHATLALLSLDTQQAVNAIQTFSLQSTPPQWLDSNRLFYGGNPMCLFGQAETYVQEAFNAYDSCVSQPPLIAYISAHSSVFAVLSVGRDPLALGMCTLSSVASSTCEGQLHTILNGLSSITEPLSNAMNQHIRPAVEAIEALNVSLMQFASNLDATNWTLLHHPLLADPTWAFYGWTFIYDWVQGRREVVSFEGDIETLVLISSVDTPQAYPSSTHPANAATKYIFTIVSYTTTVLLVVALLCLLCAIKVRFQVHGANLVWFNRVVGSIWIGRPLLFARGVTAILLLSTSPLQPHLDWSSQAQEHTRFQVIPRLWLWTLIIAGEATWVLYIVHDFFTVTFHNLTASYGPLSCFITWMALAALDLLDPVHSSATLERHCASFDMDKAIACTSGTFRIGSMDRVVVVLGIQGVACVLALVVAWKAKVGSEQPTQANRHELGVADYFFACNSATNFPATDHVSRILAGLIPFKWGNTVYIFDVKLWQLKTDSVVSTQFATVHINHDASSTRLSVHPKHVVKDVFGVTLDILGLIYAAMTLVGSVSYLEVSQVNLANDLFWASFNMTGAHTFFATWLNQQLILGLTNSTLPLNTDSINLAGSFDQATASVQAVVNFGALMHHSELISLETAIVGLRATDSCSVPWIFTPYCFVDFEQRWEMANSAGRQMRCQTMVHNGAVFLESVMRNIDFAAFYGCWGRAFDTAIGTELSSSTAGQGWLNMIASDVLLSATDEMSYWKAFNVANFDTQWQNFKVIGLVNSYSVVNMFGFSYPFTLQYQNSTFLDHQQTTFKMYWGLANDLFAISQNSSNVAGLSLVRSSPQFAFTNRSIQDILIQNGTLPGPLSSAFMIIHNVLGPFGSIDLRYIPCPEEAKSVVRDILSALRVALATNLDAQVKFSQIKTVSGAFVAIPRAWADINFIAMGGSPLCSTGTFSSSFPVVFGLAQLPSWNGICNAITLWSIEYLTRDVLVASTILANMTFASPTQIAATCALNVLYEQLCLEYVTQTVSFVSTYFSPMDLRDLESAATRAAIAIRALNIEFMQHGVVDANSPLQLYRINVLEMSEVDFAFFAWAMLVDWTLGFRETVAFEGDNSTMVLLTEYIVPLTQQVDANESQTVLSVYLRNVVLYVTYAMILIASLLLGYIVLARGVVEWLNLFLLERVGAFVWIGRPLLFVRSLTAVGLMSTSSLELTSNGYMSTFHVDNPPIYKTILAANEVAWMVSIVNDVVMAITQELTSKYAGLDSLLVWIITAALSFIFPVEHSVSIDKQCAVAQMDYQVVCTSGVITIGYVSRLTILAAIVLGVNGLSYAVARLWFQRRQSQPKVPFTSIFLYGGAENLFFKAKWIADDVYYMDRMSAVLNGILTIKSNHTIYGLDLKLWRVFHVTLHEEIRNHPITRNTLPISRRN